MKRYIHIALLALVAQCGLSNVVYGVNIAPTTLGADAIVNAIKQYSNLTEADLNQYKLLWLGRLGTYGSFLVGAASAVGAGVGSYQQAGTVQTVTPEGVPSWMTNPVVLAGLGSLGAGYVTYRTLYPRLKVGVLAKVQKFLDVCEAIDNDTLQYANDNNKFTILNYTFQNIFQLKHNYLPQSWLSASDTAVYNALSNLAQQGKIAQALLAQIGLKDDFEIKKKYILIGNYIKNLSHNENLYYLSILPGQLYKQEAERIQIDKDLEITRKKAELALLQKKAAKKEQETVVKKQEASLLQAQKIRTYGEMIADSYRNTMSTLNSIYQNREKIGYYSFLLLGGLGLGSYMYSPVWFNFARK
jgi:hypothetical protein